MAVSQSLLQLFTPFDSLTLDQLERIAPLCRIENFSKGSFLIKRGKKLPVVSYLVSGSVDLVDASFTSEVITDADSRHCYPLSQPESDDGISPVSAKAKTDTEVLVVEHEAFELLKNWQEDISATLLPNIIEEGSKDGEEQIDWMSSLLDSPLFDQVPPTQLQKLFSLFKAVVFSAGDDVIKEGDEGDYFYVIETGIAKIHNRQQGDIAVLEAGNFFGEEALVGETIRNASITMESDGVLMQLSKEHFKSLLQEPLIRYVDTAELQQKMKDEIDCKLLDIRLPVEYRKFHVHESTNIPLSSLRNKISEFDQGTTYVLTDDGGKRSEVAAHLLCQAGFSTFILQNSDKHYLVS
ncbi:MAG: cyclic nucleotide-binding domain-containing protein [Cellvibrionaceae bacterium]